jgi:hypothetical protein
MLLGFDASKTLSQFPFEFFFKDRIYQIVLQIIARDKKAQELTQAQNYANKSTSITKPVKNTVYCALILPAIKVGGVL